VKERRVGVVIIGEVEGLQVTAGIKENLLFSIRYIDSLLMKRRINHGHVPALIFSIPRPHSAGCQKPSDDCRRARRFKKAAKNQF
jgi:hypothetical protein